MDVVKIEREALVLDEREKAQLVQVLKYCKHRIKEHSKIREREYFVDYILSYLEGKNAV